MSTATGVYEVIRSTGSLVSPSETALAIIRIARDPNASIEDLSAVVETDPAMAGRILKYVNSSFVGVRNPISSLQQAVIMLGMRTVVGLSLGHSMISENRRGPCEAFDYDGYWSDSLCRAVVVRHLASKLMLVPNEAFTCGLLSQIGRLAFSCVFPEEYCEVLSVADPDDPISLSESERRVFDMDHNELTAHMIADWGLPSYFCEAVYAQDDPDSYKLAPATRSQLLVQLLHLCVQLAPAFAKRELHQERLVFLKKASDKALIEPEQFTETFQAVDEECQEMETLFNVPAYGEHAWSEIYDSACLAELEYNDKNAESKVPFPELRSRWNISPVRSA